MWLQAQTARMQLTAPPDKGSTSRAWDRGQLFACEFFLFHSDRLQQQPAEKLSRSEHSLVAI
jgi:hypothetical protein